MTDISNLNLQITGFVARLCMGDNKHESTFKEIVSILDNIEKNISAKQTGNDRVSQEMWRTTAKGV